MIEQLRTPVSPEYRQRIMSAAHLLLRVVQSEPRPLAAITRNSDDVHIGKGEVPDYITEAIAAEQERAAYRQASERRVAQQRWEGRPATARVKDWLSGKVLDDVLDTVPDSTAIDGDALCCQRTATEKIRIPNSRLGVLIGVSDWRFQGDIRIAGETYKFDPDASNVRVRLSYPLQNGKGYERSISHTLKAYDDAVITGQLPGTTNTPWSQEPYPAAPFSDQPLSAPEVMVQAITMVLVAATDSNPPTM
jgi:hypothetical protein